MLDWLIQFVSDVDHPAGLGILAASAAIEYLFPPFPGDTITLFGAVLITAYGWSFWLVFGAVMLGSMVGAMGDFYVGHRLRLVRTRTAQGTTKRRAAVDALVAKFEQHGGIYLVLNRFVPGIRALFFVAAGLAGMRASTVLFYSAVSAALWNLAILAVGALLGANFETLLDYARQYTVAVYIIIGVLIALWLVRRFLKRKTVDAERSADDAERSTDDAERSTDDG